MSAPAHIKLRKETRFFERFYREHGETELADRELQIIALCNTVDDLVTIVNRMRQRLHIVAPLDKTSAQALDYLNRNDLQGSPLREGGQ